MEIILGLFSVGTIILLANWVEKQANDWFHRFYEWMLLAFNVPAFLLGVILSTVPNQRLTEVVQLDLDFTSLGAWLIVMAIWGSLAALPGFRRFLGRWSKTFNPNSAVHATALALIGYLIGNTLATLSQGGLEGLAMTAEEASLLDVLASQFLFAALALMGVGIFIRRGGSSLRQRLGLERPTRAQLFLGLSAILVLVVAQAVAGYAWTLIDPQQAELLDEISATLLGDIDSVWEWFLLALATGFGEELLFRGALQPIFGLTATSLIFAIAHVQYGLTPVTVFVFFLALVLGLIRHRTNTTVAIFVHFGYNFTLGLLALLAVALQ